MKYAENDERSSRLQNIGMAMAGLTVGAFALKDSGNMKYISKALGDAGSTLGKISDDLSNKAFKELDYTTLKGIAKNRVLNEDSTWKLAKKDMGIDLDYGRGLLSSVLNYNNLRSSGEFHLKDEMFDAIQKNHMITSLNDNLKDQSGDFFAELTKLVDESLSNKSSFFEQSEDRTVLIKSQLDERLQGSILEPKKGEIKNIMEEALNNSEELRRNFESDYDNNLKDKLVNTYKEEIINKYSKKDEFFKSTLDRAATVGDLLTNMRNKQVTVNNSELYEGFNDNIYDTLKSLVDEDARFNDLVIDKSTLRMNKSGELYSTKAVNDLAYKAKEEVADTIFGKLFSLRSFVDNKKAPDFFYLAQGSYDSKLANLTGSKNGILNSDHFKIGEKIYQYKDKELQHVQDADDLYLMSGRHGSLNVLNNRLQGNFYKKTQENKTLNWLDFNTTGVNALEDVKGFFGKFNKDSDWVNHTYKRLFNPDTYKNINEKTSTQFNKDIKQINSLFNHRTFAPSNRTINELKKVLGPEAAKILEVLNEKNPSEKLLKNDYIQFMNNDLKSLINKYRKNSSSVNTIAQIGSLGDKNGMNILKYNDLLKREIIKEALMVDSNHSNRYMSNSIHGYSVSQSKIKKMNIDKADKKNLTNIFNWGILQKETGSFSTSQHNIYDKNRKMTIMNNFGNIVKGASENAQTNTFLENFRTGITSFVKNNSSSLHDVVMETDNSIQKGYSNNQWVTMRKTISPLDVIKSLNDEQKAKATAKGFAKQFFAGRNNTKDITTTTFLPYHMVNRLVTPLEKFGLGFSGDNTKSVLDLTKNIAVKRILPIVGVAYAASYLNFEAENITGKSFTQDYYNAKANFGVGVKTISQTFGLDDNHKRSRMYNPITNYWLGDYKDKDEYLDYLENGYDPVRKGRWWSFGSASELRGGKISYYEPNKLRQSYSHYKDVSLYGSTDEKWKHSPIPTLRHPLSTLRFAVNPYWLEEKHYWDRPYPVTAPLFEEETPWGAVLNPTLGQLLKPQRKMHKAELKGSLLDVRTIIANRNNEIKNRAADNRLVRVDDAGFTPMNFHPKSTASMNEAIYSINFDKKGKVTSAGLNGSKYSANMAGVDHTFVPVIKGGNGSDPSTTQVQYNNVQDSSVFNDFLLKGVTSLVSSGITSQNTSLNLIGEINRSIKGRANNSNEYQSSGIINENAKLHENPFNVESERVKNKYLKNLNIQDIGTKSDYVASLKYSAKQLSGMYGFLFDTILPASHGYQLENAGQMNSFVRGFWDSNMGGAGGDFMEIARRFFPHENHDIEQINPLRNTMPLWMPERYQTGDPFTKVTKGEARLPGAGYETLNRLHPDQYGRYGAFDRYKILADISPGSDEYKTWKKIAKEEISDPKLKTQMEQIEKRVKKQSSSHQFYNYQFLGKNMENKHAVIDKVENTGKFKIVGSDEQYTIAGIKPLKDEEKQSYIHEYLKPGMMVNLEYEKNQYRNKDSNGNIVALVNFGTESISKKMWEEGKAKEKDNKETLADNLFAASGTNKTLGPVFELIGHAQIPYLHNKYLRIDSPMESYKKEQVYGTNYSTWGHPIKGFITPTFQSGFSKSPAIQVLGLATWMLSNKARKDGAEGVTKFAAHSLFAFTNPYALAGGIIGALPRMNWGSKASIWNSKNGANIAAAVGAVGYGFAHLNNPFLSVANFGAAGFAIANQLKVPAKELPNVSKLLKISEKEGAVIGGNKGAIIGAAVGLGLSALKNPEFSLTKLTDKYIPKRTKEKWEMEEYFDRLEYIKYTNLYHQAARQAKRKDGVDIAKIVNKFEYNEKKNDKAILKLEKQKLKASLIPDEKTKQQLTYAIDNAIYKLQVPEQYYNLGKYSKAALAYKKAADTTIYGLNQHSSSADVLRALPKYDRDYFLEFANEKDPKARKKILKYVSPYKQKALHVMWGDKIKKEKSNKDFFSTHNLPNMFWSGWKPTENLDNIKMKTIENEGMLLSDFGLYDSAKEEPAYKQSPAINNIHAAPSPLSLQRDMLTLLNGVGFHSTDVTVEPKSAPGIQFVTNIGRVTQYNLQQKVQNALYKLF